jgi:hypothetical protein
MNRNISIIPLVAILLFIVALIFPLTAAAQTPDDTVPPTLTVSLSGETLDIEVTDDASGVAAVYIDKHIVSALANGKASVNLRDYAGNGRDITVYATDAAGNRSESEVIRNPFYQESGATPGTPGGDQLSPTPSSIGGGEGTSEGEDEPDPNAFTSDGSGTVQDNATEKDGKEFFAITAEDGSIYYLVIDRQRGTENVYFLAPVTLDDLMGLAQSEDGSAFISQDTVTPGAATQARPETTQPGVSGTDPDGPAKEGGNGGSLVFILIAMAIAGAAGYYFKIVKPRRQAPMEDDYEYEDDDEDVYGDADDGEADEEGYFFEDEPYGNPDEDGDGQEEKAPPETSPET